MITTLIIDALLVSGGYLFGAVWASAPLQRRLNAKCADLADAKDALDAVNLDLTSTRELLADANEALSCRDQALAAHMEYVGTLRAQIAKWVPRRGPKGLFMKKAA